MCSVYGFVDLSVIGLLGLMIEQGLLYLACPKSQVLIPDCLNVEYVAEHV